MLVLRWLLITLLACAQGSFVVKPQIARRSVSATRPAIIALAELPPEGPLHTPVPGFEMEPAAVAADVNPAAIAVVLASLAAFQPEFVMAKGGEFGIFEGRIVSLAHPLVMGLMYAASAWAGYTGLQWRRLRELGTQITGLKAELKPLQQRMDAASDDTPPPAALSKEAKELQTKIDELSATRKELAQDNLREKHYQVGSVILGLGTSFAIEGPVNTFLRAQKLFPGPHLYAGAGIVVAWAMAASTVPLMAKGKDWARTAHIGFNVLALGLFTWQLPTGWEIMLKVIKFTKFP